MISVFWLCLFVVVYTYVLYPVAVAALALLISKFKSREPAGFHAVSPPTISVIFCARDEEQNVAQKLRDLVRQDYDHRKMEIIVVSDGSTDGTKSSIVASRESIAAAGCEIPIKLIEKSVSEGKAAGLNDAVAISTGEVLIMTDARQRFGQNSGDNQTIRYLVDSLSDPEVGCVSGELCFVDENSGDLAQNLGFYWRYEKWIRKSEAAIDSVPGVTGAIYAIRRSLFRAMPVMTLLDDVLIPLRVVLCGYRVGFDERAVARDVATQDPSREWRRKVRTLAGNWQLLGIIPNAFSPVRNRIWCQFVSHKILRLVVPLALFLLLVISGTVESSPYREFFLAQLLFYAVAVMTWILPGTRGIRVFGIVHTFMLLNLAAVAGFWAWVTGHSASTWDRGT